MTIPVPLSNVHLSPRESQVLQCIAQGKSNKTIAGELGISEQTVKNHVSELLFKLGVESRTQLAIRVGKKKDGKGNRVKWHWYALTILALLISIYVLLGLFLLAVEIKCG